MPTPIEWTDETWNVINGCSVVSPGCTNCYAMRLAGTRFRNHPSREGLTIDSKAGPVWNGEVRLIEHLIDQPLRWTRPRRIFVCAHGDLFFEGVACSWVERVLGVAIAAHHLRGHTFQILSKRSDRMREMLNHPSFWEAVNAYAADAVMSRVDPLDRRSDDARATLDDYGPDNPPPGLWLGVSVEDQTRANQRIPDLLATPAAVRWISAEPLLAPLSVVEWLSSWCPLCAKPLLGGAHFSGRHCGTCHSETARIDWGVVGGESGPGSRPMHPAWVRQLRDQFAAAGVPFLFKQWGDYLPDDDNTDADGFAWQAGSADPRTYRWPDGLESIRIGKRQAGRSLDRRFHDEFPGGGL